MRGYIVVFMPQDRGQPGTLGHLWDCGYAAPRYFASDRAKIGVDFLVDSG